MVRENIEARKVVMDRRGFSAEKYMEEQTKYILERIEGGEGRLYLEFGGHLVGDKHAMCILLCVD